MTKTNIVTTFTAIAALFALAYSTPSSAEERTAGKTVSDYQKQYSAKIKGNSKHWQKALPKHWDSKDEHVQQWDGQNWDPSKWDDKYWTAESTIKKFFDNGVFTRQYKKRDHLVIEVGPMFYKFSDQDQRRSLQLLADLHKVFQSGHSSFQVRDGKNHKQIGLFTKNGLSLY